MTALNGSWNALILDLKERLDHAEEYLETVKGHVVEAQGEVTKLRGMLRAAGELEATAPKPKQKPKPRTTEETMALVRRGIEQFLHKEPAIPDVPGSFTVPTLSEEIGVDTTTVRKALNELRDAGEIRVAGLAPANGGRQPQAWVSA